jgi:hypothetical protein
MEHKRLLHCVIQRTVTQIYSPFYPFLPLGSNEIRIAQRLVCEEKSWRPQAAARSAFQYVSHRPLW